MGGSHSWEGRVEIFLSGAWGTVSDDGARSTDARVVCRQLGYSTYSILYYILITCIMENMHNMQVISLYELICCVVHFYTLSFFWIIIYCVSSLLHFLSKCIIFVGDFNFPDIDWSVLMGSTSQSCNFIFDCNLFQHVSEYTHVRGNLLDLVITSASAVVDHVTVHPQSVVYKFF